LLSVPFPSFHHRLESEGPSWGGARPDVGFGFRYHFRSTAAAGAAAAEEAQRRAAEETRQARVAEINAARTEERHRTLIASQSRHIRPASARRAGGLNTREEDAVATMILGGCSDREIAVAYGISREAIRQIRRIVEVPGSSRSQSLRHRQLEEALQGEEQDQQESDR